MYTHGTMVGYMLLSLHKEQYLENESLEMRIQILKMYSTPYGMPSLKTYASA